MALPLFAEQHVAILAPTGRDAELLRNALADAGIRCVVVGDVKLLAASLDAQIGGVLIAEEALAPDPSFEAFRLAVDRQPNWSDIPVLLMTSSGADSPTAVRALDGISNVTLLERPLRVGSLVSNARAALRARARQYQIRDHMNERARSERALRDADHRKDEFLATLAHELRNPLAPIRNAARLMRMEPAEAAARDAPAVIERQISHLSRLVEDLLDVSRISRGKIELRLDTVDLVEVLRTAVETSEPLLRERRHRLALELPLEPVGILADATRLAQVVSNLLNNAAKYTPPGGQIALSARRAHGEVTIRVQDTGIGIDPVLLPNIFDMFVQADNRIERETGGLGIGLTLVRHFVEMHHGKVSAEAAAGGGTEFVVTLPAPDTVTPRASARPPGSRSAPVEAGNLRILVVDDNRDNADSIGVILRLLGHDVTIAYSGADALERFVEPLPEVALLDIGMPLMNGYEVARRMRASPRGRDVLLVAITGWGQESDRKRSRAAGFDHHLVKPMELEHLIPLLDAKRTALALVAESAIPLRRRVASS